MLKNKFFIFFNFLFLLLLSSTVFAAQDTTVVVDNAPIRIEPKDDAKILEYLTLGMEIRISNYPMTGGWYKTRASSGIYGWVHLKFLSIGSKIKKDGDDPLALEAEKIAKPERDRKFFLRILGGFDFFKPDDLNSVFDFSELNTGNMVGGELGMFLSERVACLFRFEAILKDVVAREKISGIHFNLGIRSYPVMGGFDFFLLKLPALRLSFGIFGGFGVATSFSSEASSLASPNSVVLQRTPFTTLARLNLTRPLGRIVSVFAEIGYRYLKTEEIDTQFASGLSGGAEIYGKDGTFKPRVIDLSGPTLAVGLGLHF